jgi:phosphate transport system substrate-binding protein
MNLPLITSRLRTASARTAFPRPLAGFVIACATVLSSTSSNAELQGEITIDGSSTVYPISEAVASAFSQAYPEVRVTVGKSGTGGGFKRFEKGETDISDASRPIKASELKGVMEAGIEFIEIPVAYDGLTIAVNKKNTWAKQMTLDDLKRIFLAGDTAKSWKDLDPSYPDVPIRVYAPGTDSGTFDYFKEVVADGREFTTMSTSEDDNVLVNDVIGDEGGVGFFGASYYFENKDKLNSVKIVNNEGEAVGPSPTSIEDGSYNPFSRPLFIYVNAESLKRPEVAAFVEFYLDEGPEMAENVGSVRLPMSVYDRAREKVEDVETGTLYLDENMNSVDGLVTEIYN